MLVSTRKLIALFIPDLFMSNAHCIFSVLRYALADWRLDEDSQKFEFIILIFGEDLYATHCYSAVISNVSHSILLH